MLLLRLRDCCCCCGASFIAYYCLHGSYSIARFILWVMRIHEAENSLSSVVNVDKQLMNGFNINVKRFFMLL